MANFKRQVVLKKDSLSLILNNEPDKYGKCTIDSVNCQVTLSEIVFVNEMYSPAHLTVKATLVSLGQQDSQNEQNKSSLPSYQSIVDCFLLAKASVQKVKSQENFETNFYVHEVRPTYVNNGNMVILYLDIYSADKLMTLDKYSKSYVHASLYADILANEASKFIIEEKGISVSTRDYSTRLKYSKSKTEAASDMEEIKHPYLVQYNESFYDFLIRSANRTGEFLYFADGQLTLGVDAGAKTTQVSKYYSLAVESCNNSVRPTTGISRNYVVNLEEKDGQHEKSSDGLRYTQPTSNDDYLVHYIKDNFDKVGKEYNPGWRLLPAAYKALVTTPTIGALIKAIVVDLAAIEISKAVGYAVLTNSKYNKSAIDEAPGGINGDKGVFSGSYRSDSDYIADWYVNANADFYNKIDECEKKMGSRTVTLTFDDFEEKDIPNYQVGQLIEVFGSKYVVTNVHYSEVFDGRSMRYEHVIKALPLLKVKVNKSTHEAELWLADEKGAPTDQIIQICCPTALPEEKRIRKAAAQTAWVVDSDDPKYQGRVRIRYAWDEKGVDSPWIRQAEPAAGKEGGVNFRLYKDDEVMIGYENDNIEQPYIIGALYHGEDGGIKNGVPVGRNKYVQNTHLIRNRSGHQMVISEKKNNTSFFAGVNPSIALLTPGFNILRGLINMDDPNGSTLAGGIQFNDKYGIYNVSMSSDQRLISIASPMGNIKLSAFTGISISAPRGDISISGKNVSIKAANKLTLESGSNAKNTEFKKTWHDDGLGAAIKNAAVQGISGGIANFVASFVDLSLLRHTFECFLPPVDGTLQIKSHRYLLLEAGKGTATIPQKGFTDGVPVGEKDPINYNKFYGGSATAVKIVQHIQLLDAMISELLNDYTTLLLNVQNSATAYTNTRGGVPEPKRSNIKEGHRAFDPIKNIIKKKKFDSKVISVNNQNLDGDNDYAEVVKQAESLWSAIKALVNFIETRKEKENAYAIQYRYWQEGKLGAAFVKAKNRLLDIFAVALSRPISFQGISDAITIILNIRRDRPKARVIGEYLIELRKEKILDEIAKTKEIEFAENGEWQVLREITDVEMPQQTNAINGDTDMAAFVGRLQFHAASESSLKSAATKNVDIWSPFFEGGKWGYDRAKYGRILFSDQDENTYYVDSVNKNIQSNPNPNIGEIQKLVVEICDKEKKVRNNPGNN